MAHEERRTTAADSDLRFDPKGLNAGREWQNFAITARSNEVGPASASLGREASALLTIRRSL